jgi:hypothetical protein
MEALRDLSAYPDQRRKGRAAVDTIPVAWRDIFQKISLRPYSDAEIWTG